MCIRDRAEASTSQAETSRLRAVLEERRISIDERLRLVELSIKRTMAQASTSQAEASMMRANVERVARNPNFLRELATMRMAPANIEATAVAGIFRRHGFDLVGGNANFSRNPKAAQRALHEATEAMAILGRLRAVAPGRERVALPLEMIDAVGEAASRGIKTMRSHGRSLPGSRHPRNQIP